MLQPIEKAVYLNAGRRLLLSLHVLFNLNAQYDFHTVLAGLEWNDVSIDGATV